VCNLVRQLTAQGVGLLITDHNVRETLKIIDRGCVLREGHLLAEGSPEEIVADPDARRLYLGEAFSCS
jgi:lipopolysaccharide export system ATP-binding protein